MLSIPLKRQLRRCNGLLTDIGTSHLMDRAWNSQTLSPLTLLPQNLIFNVLRGVPKLIDEVLLLLSYLGCVLIRVHWHQVIVLLCTSLILRLNDTIPVGQKFIILTLGKCRYVFPSSLPWPLSRQGMPRTIKRCAAHPSNGLRFELNIWPDLICPGI